MSLSAIKAYTNPAVNGAAPDTAAISAKYGINETRKTASAQSNSQESLNSNLITRKERDFFINLFPDNAEQLEKHVVFNRNGRLQTAGNPKGTIFDSRI